MAVSCVAEGESASGEERSARRAEAQGQVGECTGRQLLGARRCSLLAARTSFQSPAQPHTCDGRDDPGTDTTVPETLAVAGGAVRPNSVVRATLLT